jgi:hypothetical protein
MCDEHSMADTAILPEEFLVPRVNLDVVDTLQPGSKTDVLLAFNWLKVLAEFARAVQQLDFSEFGKQPDGVLSRVNTIRGLIGGDHERRQANSEAGREDQGGVAGLSGHEDVPTDRSDLGDSTGE